MSPKGIASAGSALITEKASIEDYASFGNLPAGEL